MIYTISNDILTVQVNTLGGELVSVKKGGKERLWQNENGGWSGHAPILFPVCGDCNMIVRGQKYPIKKHGFARDTEFSLIGMGKDEITMGFSSNESTKAVYPFDFEFRVTYRLDGAKLTIEYEVVNPDKRIAYIACGCHESYQLDGEIGEYEAVFNKTEKFDSYVHSPELAALTGEVLNFGESDRIAFPQEFMETDCLILKNLNSTEVTLQKIGGEKVAKLTFDGFKNFLFWHPAGSRMVCMEPWHNLPDRVDEKELEISRKEGIQCVFPESKEKYTHTIEYFN